VSNFGLSGTVGNLITISSEAAGFQFTLSKASGTVNAQYLSIQDSIATGGATWNALTSNGNVDAGNNTGWIFGSAATGNMFLMFN
jgi:FlaG/FlaF family flagellin (archaellin)